MSMIEERIKLLEERENYFKVDIELNENSKKGRNDDFLDEKEEETMIRMREINMKIRKEVEKKGIKMDENLLIDKDILFFTDRNHSKNNLQMNSTINEGKTSKNIDKTVKEDSKKNEINFLNNNKFRNSVLQIKMNKANNISIFNNAYNKDVMNEFGNKFSFVEQHKNENNVTQIQENHKAVVVSNQHNSGTSLNKFFSNRQLDLTRPSPNKVFFFGRKK